jgi:glycosyltransferase involved in cell wall biosynthesis
LLVGHDAHDHGAQRLLLNIARHMHRKLGINLQIAILGPGKLVPAYEEIAPTTVCLDQLSFRNLAARVRAEGFDVAICNSTPGGRYAEILKDHNLRTITLIHELPTLLQNYGLSDTASAISSHADVCVFPSELVKSKFEKFTGMRPRRAVIQPQGLYDDISADVNVRKDVREELGIPADARIVVNAAYGDLRKGFDLFRQVAQRFEAIDPKVCFVWVGTIDRELKSWLVDHASNAAHVPNFLTIGFRNDLGRILLASDVFLLTSREDPFPTVIIDALAAGLPIVAMQDGGGFVDLFTREFVGQLARFDDVNGLCDLVRYYLELAPDGTAEQAKLRRQLVEREFDFGKYVFELLRLGQLVDKSVSVIVPNYNYASYLKQRLSGIFNQTYPIYEIIVLDDASTDGSLATLDQIAAEFQRDIVRVVNTKNSGSVFNQWRKGVECARGDLVWIAEADDDARPDFVAKLERFFRDKPDTIFAFSDSATIDESGRKTSGDYQFYYSSIGEGVLTKEFIMDARKFAVEHLSVRNHILNVSSVLWSRTRLAAALARAGSSIEEYRLAGDWRLYIEACLLDGQIAFTPQPINIHRRHTTSVTGSTTLREQIKEISQIHDVVLNRFPAAKPVEKQMCAYRQELTERAKTIGGGETHG